MIEFDFVLNHIGHLGRYQVLLVFLVYWHGIPAGLHNIASVFYAAPVQFRYVEVNCQDYIWKLIWIYTHSSKISFVKCFSEQYRVAQLVLRGGGTRST